MKVVLAIALASLLAVPTGAFMVLGPDVVGGRTDRAIEYVASTLPVPRVRLPDATEDGEVTRTLTWTYRGVPYAWTVSVPEDALREYERAPRTLDPRTYGVYVTDPGEDPAIARLATGLEEAADAREYHGVHRLNFILALVQGIPYVQDRDVAGQEDYPQFSAETVSGHRGDCEDAVVLFVSLARAMGFDATLLLLDGHMAAGVNHPDAPGPRFGGYAFAETSVPGYRVGEVPREFHGHAVTPLEVAPQPALQLAWRVTPEESGWRVHVGVWNNGTASARDVQVAVSARTARGDSGDERFMVDALPSRGHAETTVHVPFVAGHDVEVRAVAWAGNAEAVGGSVPVAGITAPVSAASPASGALAPVG